MTRTIEIHTFDNRTQRVEAIDTNTPGLGVTRAVFKEPGYDYWNVTHVATGLLIPGHFTTSEQAVAFADALAPLGDWTTPDGPDRTHAFNAAYVAVMRSRGGLRPWELEPNAATA